MSEVNNPKGKRIFLNDEVYLIEERRCITNINSGVEAVFSCPEVSIIKELVMANGKPLSRRYLLDNCWGGRIVTNTSLSVAINKIRERLNNVGLDDAIFTVPRYGYQINLTDEERFEVEPLFCPDTISDNSSEKNIINDEERFEVEPLFCSGAISDISSKKNNINDDKKQGVKNYKKTSIKLNINYLIFFASWMFSMLTFSRYFL